MRVRRMRLLVTGCCKFCNLVWVSSPCIASIILLPVCCQSFTIKIFLIQHSLLDIKCFSQLSFMLITFLLQFIFFISLFNNIQMIDMETFFMALVRAHQKLVSVTQDSTPLLHYHRKHRQMDSILEPLPINSLMETLSSK